MYKHNNNKNAMAANLEKDKIVIEGEDMTVIITPPTHGTELLTKAAYNIKETGLPTNQDIESFGDQIIEIFEMSKKNAKDERAERIVDSAQRVVQSMQRGILERNHDELLQRIAKRLMDQSQNVGDMQRNLSMQNKEMKKMNKDSKKINQKILAVLPLIAKMSLTIVKDSSFRELLLSLMEIFSRAFTRVGKSVGAPNITDALKDDIRNNSQISVENTKAALQNLAYDMTVNVGINASLKEEEKDELIEKAIRVLGKLKTSETYRTLLYQIFIISDDVIELWKNFKSHPELKERYRDSTSTINDVKLLIERTSGRSLKKWEKYLEKLIAIKDDSLFKLVRHDIEDLVFDTEHKYNSKEKFRAHFEKIRMEALELDKAFRGLFLKFFTETKEIFMGMANDPVITGIKDNLNNLIQEIFVDEKGTPSLAVMRGSFSRIRDCFFPILRHRLTHLDLPGVEIDTPKFAFSLSDVRFNLADLIPENFHLDFDNSLTFDVKKLKRKGDFNFRIYIGPFSTKLEKVKFYIKKKTGMKFKDYGKLSLRLKKLGILACFHVRLNKYRVDWIECTKVRTYLDGLKIKIHKAHHKALDKMAIGFLPAAKPQIEKQIDKKLYDVLNNQVCDRINEGLEDFERRKRESRHRDRSEHHHRRAKSERRHKKSKRAKRAKRAIDLAKIKVPKVERKELERRKNKGHLKRQFAKLDNSGVAVLSSSVSDIESDQTGFKGELKHRQEEIVGVGAEVYEGYGKSHGKSHHHHHPKVVAEEEYYERESDYDAKPGFKGELKHKQKEIVGTGAEVYEGYGKSHGKSHHQPMLIAEDKEGRRHRPKMEKGDNLAMKESPHITHQPKLVAGEDTLGMKESQQKGQMLPYEDELMKEEGHHKSQNQPKLVAGEDTLGKKESRQKLTMLPYEDELEKEEGHHKSQNQPKLVAGEDTLGKKTTDKDVKLKEESIKKTKEVTIQDKGGVYDKEKKKEVRKTPPKSKLIEDKDLEKKRKEITKADLEVKGSSPNPKLVADKDIEGSGKKDKHVPAEKKFKDEFAQKRKEGTKGDKQTV